MPNSNTSTAANAPVPRRRIGRALCLGLITLALLWSLPHPTWTDVAVPEGSQDSAGARWAFRTSRHLVELSGKGATADGTELTGPCFADNGQSLYFTRSRPGVRADIVRSRWNGQRWSRPDPVRELNSVDDDRRVTVAAKTGTLIVASNRSGTRGGFDLWESAGANGRAGRPKNLSAEINTGADEFDPAISADGLMLVFARRSSSGVTELFATHREQSSGSWPAAEPIRTINGLPGDKLSPTFTSDGSKIWFVVRRDSATGSEAKSDLYQSAVTGHTFGSPTRLRETAGLRDAIHEPAVSPDGRTLIFASHREGNWQLSQSQSERVVSRVSFSSAHLERFGRAKWGIPAGLAVFLLIAARATRRQTTSAANSARKDKSASTPLRTAAGDVGGPVRRSASPANPLASWPTGTDASSPGKTIEKPQDVMSRGLVAASDRAATPRSTTKPAPITDAAPPKRRGLRRTVAALMLAALGLFAFRSRDRWLVPPIEFVPLELSQFGQFRETATPTRDELSPVARLATGRTSAPEPSAIPLDDASLRQIARWPKELAVVRAPAPAFVATPVAPELASVNKVVTTKTATLPRPTNRDGRIPVEQAAAEPIELAQATINPEKPLVLATVNVLRREIASATLSPSSRQSPSPWPSGLASAAKMILQPNELTAVAPPLIAIAALKLDRKGPNANGGTTAAPAEPDAAPLATQTVNEATLAALPEPLKRFEPMPAGTPPKSNPLRSLPPVDSPRSTASSDVVPPVVNAGLSPNGAAAGTPRRASRDVTPTEIGPEASTSGQNTSEPTILLAVAETIRELLPAAALSPLNRAEVLSAGAKPAERSSIAAALSQFFPVSFFGSAPESQWTPESATKSVSSLPHRMPPAEPAGVPESVAPVFETP